MPGLVGFGASADEMATAELGLAVNQEKNKELNDKAANAANAEGIGALAGTYLGFKASRKSPQAAPAAGGIASRANDANIGTSDVVGGVLGHTLNQLGSGFGGVLNQHVATGNVEMNDPSGILSGAVSPPAPEIPTGGDS